jgi:hypothetical protein
MMVTLAGAMSTAEIGKILQKWFVKTKFKLYLVLVQI